MREAEDKFPLASALFLHLLSPSPKYPQKVLPVGHWQTERSKSGYLVLHSKSTYFGMKKAKICDGGEVKCSFTGKGQVLASRTPLLPAPLLHVKTPFVLHHHSAWSHMKYFYSYGRLKDTHGSFIMSSLLPREVSEKEGNLHQLQTYPQTSLMLEAGNDCACGQRRNGGEEAAKNNWWVDAFKEIHAWLKAISWPIYKFFQELQRRRYVHDEPRKEGKKINIFTCLC